MVWVAEPIRSRTKIPPRTPDFLVRVEAVILASLLALLISSPTASAQKRGAQRNAPTAEQSSPKAAAGQSSPKAAAVGLPEGNTGSPLSNALSDCDKAAEDSKPISLPGAKGELKLDSCFRGRDHLVCSYNALIIETQSLLKEYNTVIQASYPAVGNIDDICRITTDAIATDLQKTTEFFSRFRLLKAEYDSITNCGNKIAESFKAVVLPDMSKAPNLLTSMIDTIRNDVNHVSTVENQVIELGRSLEASQRAMIAIQKLKRVACMIHPNTETGANPVPITEQRNTSDTGRPNSGAKLQKMEIPQGFCGFETTADGSRKWVCRVTGPLGTSSEAP